MHLCFSTGAGVQEGGVGRGREEVARELDHRVEVDLHCATTGRHTHGEDKGIGVVCVHREDVEGGNRRCGRWGEWEHCSCGIGFTCHKSAIHLDVNMHCIDSHGDLRAGEDRTTFCLQGDRRPCIATWFSNYMHLQPLHYRYHL